MKNKAFEAAEPLFEAILKLDNIDDCRAFFEDLCTIQELQTLGQRFEVAKQLDSGCNYVDISRATGASTATICRVNKALVWGAGGYRTMLDKIKSEQESEEQP